jgi:hypothetical protein
MLDDGPRRRLDIGHVGSAVARERRRHADDHQVAALKGGKFGGGGKALLGDQPLEIGAHDGTDIGLTGGDPLRLLRIHVETDDHIAGAGDRHRKRQADIAKPDHPDHGLPPGNALGKPINRLAVRFCAHSGLIKPCSDRSPGRWQA